MNQEDEIKNLVEEELEIAKENQIILGKILKWQRWNQVGNLVKWLILIGSAVGVFYYFQPILDSLIDTYKEIIDSAGVVKIENILP